MYDILQYEGDLLPRRGSICQIPTFLVLEKSVVIFEIEEVSGHFATPFAVEASESYFVLRPADFVLGDHGHRDD